MKIRRPRHRVEAGDFSHVRAVKFHRVNLRNRAGLVEPAPNNALAVRREKRAAIVAGHPGKSRLLRAVGVHDVNFAKVRQVDLAQFYFLLHQVVRVGAARGTEDNFLAVWRVTGLGIVAPRVRELAEVAAVQVRGEDVHCLVVVPRVTALLAGGAEGEFRLLLGLALRVVMRRAKEHALAVGAKKCAGRLAVSGRHTGGVAGFKIDRVNLVKRVARFTFTLENQPRTVSTEVPLAAAPPLKRQLSHTRQESLLPLGLGRAWPSGDRHRGGDGAGCKKVSIQHFAVVLVSTRRFFN